MHLCRSKLDGGMSFRDVSIMNDVMLAKQFWRMVENPRSLVAIFFKAKYAKNADIIHAELGNSPSFAWRGIWCAGMKVKNCIAHDHNGGLNCLLECSGKFTTGSAYLKLKELWDLDVVNVRGESSFGIGFGG